MSDNLREQLTDVTKELGQVDAQLSSLRERKRKLLATKTQIEAQLSHSIQESSSRWEGQSFNWSSDVRSVLQNVFKLQSFRPLQLSTINASLSGEDVLLIMSTGGGKSLCYQLPALLDAQKMLTLVISPLISLMEDQTLALKRLGVDAKMLCQATEKTEVTRILQSMSDPKSGLNLLYVTPERLAKSKRFMNKLEKCFEAKRLRLIAIDEVHCCSQWGHDFRPDYKFLNILKRQFPTVPILGLTATATAAVLEDVKKMLGIPHAYIFRASFNRPNLYYELRPKPLEQKEIVNDLINIIKSRFHKQSGIVYCFSRKESEQLAHELQKNDIYAACYHAELPAERRSWVHQKWTENTCHVIVATVAFGMGIDKSDVRFVIHHSMPKSLENYYQESGRAGRDNQTAVCLLYYRVSDLFRVSSMVCSEQTGLENLYSMLAYSINTRSCRRDSIAQHFGENWTQDWCKEMCDICDMKTVALEDTEVGELCAPLLKIVPVVGDKSNRLTALKVVDAWLKAKKCLNREDCERILAYLLLENYIREDFHFTPYSIISYIVPGPRFEQISNGVTVQIRKVNLATITKSRKRKIDK